MRQQGSRGALIFVIFQKKLSAYNVWGQGAESQNFAGNALCAPTGFVSVARLIKTICLTANTINASETLECGV